MVEKSETDIKKNDESEIHIEYINYTWSIFYIILILIPIIAVTYLLFTWDISEQMGFQIGFYYLIAILMAIIWMIFYYYLVVPPLSKKELIISKSTIKFFYSNSLIFNEEWDNIKKVTVKLGEDKTPTIVFTRKKIKKSVINGKYSYLPHGIPSKLTLSGDREKNFSESKLIEIFINLQEICAEKDIKLTDELKWGEEIELLIDEMEDAN